MWLLQVVFWLGAIFLATAVTFAVLSGVVVLLLRVVRPRRDPGGAVPTRMAAARNSLLLGAAYVGIFFVSLLLGAMVVMGS